jgi:hypothetical protein
MAHHPVKARLKPFRQEPAEGGIKALPRLWEG